jgi:hypothetical protein
MDSAQEVLKQMGAPVDFEEFYFSEVRILLFWFIEILTLATVSMRVQKSRTTFFLSLILLALNADQSGSQPQHGGCHGVR